MFFFFNMYRLLLVELVDFGKLQSGISGSLLSLHSFRFLIWRKKERRNRVRSVGVFSTAGIWD